MSDNDKSRQHAATDDLLAFPAAVEEALNRASEQAVLRHQLLGQDVAIWRDGKMVVISSQTPALVPPVSDEGGPSSSAA
jgi:hypothetical protein